MRDKLLYALSNVARNLNKITLVNNDLKDICEDDIAWENNSNLIQLFKLLEEVNSDVTTLEGYYNALKKDTETHLVEAGYTREHSTYGEWVKKDEQ